MAILQSDGVNHTSDLIFRRSGTEIASVVSDGLKATVLRVTGGTAGRIFYSISATNYEIGPGSGTGDPDSLGFFAPGNRSITWFTNNVFRGRINGSGNCIFGNDSIYFGIPSIFTIQNNSNQDKLVIGGYGDFLGFGISFCPGINAATPCRFLNAGGGTVGSISTNASNTSFNTSSDYRLKENFVPIENAISRLKQLPVYRFNFIIEPERVVDGFIAHEAQEVVPECVTGIKDEVDEKGNPVYQGIDQSKIVPLLTAALQEAIAKIEILEAKVEQLEAI